MASPELPRDKVTYLSREERINIIKWILNHYNVHNYNYMLLKLFNPDGKLLENEIIKFKDIEKIKYNHLQEMREWYSAKMENFRKSNSENLLFELNYPSNIINTNDEYFYSAYSNDITEILFSDKSVIWCSQNFDQAFLHPFNVIRSVDVFEPVIYRFKLADNYRIIKSDNLSNTNIFKDIFPKDACDHLNEIFDFNGENNKNILLILSEYNKMVPDDLKIHGYYNKSDQDEFAFVNFKDLNKIDIIKKKYTEIEYKYENVIKTSIFPIESKLEYNKLNEIASYLEKHNKKRMSCGLPQSINRIICIKYESFDSDDVIETYTCKENMDDYYKNKYLKYKNKYLNLRNNIN
jgi:hypothetical protein